MISRGDVITHTSKACTEKGITFILIPSVLRLWARLIWSWALSSCLMRIVLLGISTVRAIQTICCKWGTWCLCNRCLLSFITLLIWIRRWLCCSYWIMIDHFHNRSLVKKALFMLIVIVLFLTLRLTSLKLHVFLYLSNFLHLFIVQLIEFIQDALLLLNI